MFDELSDPDWEMIETMTNFLSDQLLDRVDTIMEENDRCEIECPKYHREWLTPELAMTAAVAAMREAIIDTRVVVAERAEG